jgi:hypothetical protein
VFPICLVLAIVASQKGPNEPLSSSTVEASSKLSEAFLDSAKVALCVACACGGVRSLIFTDGESRAIEVFRVVPLLVVDGNIGTFPSQVLPMMNGLHRTISLPSELTNKAMLPGNGARK